MKTNDGPKTRVTNDADRRDAVDAFVNSLKRRRHDAPAKTMLPEDIEIVTRLVERDEDPAALFTQTATTVGVNVHSATTADWLDVVAKLLQEHQAKDAAIPPVGDGFFEAERVEQLKQRLVADGVAAKSETDDETLFSVDMAITGVAAAIAETGTIACEARPIIARGSSLIPPVHIAVVAAEQLLPDLCDYFNVLSKRSELPADASLITGPSKTADIEGVLVTGVHGPATVHVVLVRES